MVFLRKKRAHELLKIKKLSVGEMAAFLEISESHCSNIINGRKKITMRQFKILVEHFGSDIFALIVNWDALPISEQEGTKLKNMLIYGMEEM